VIVSFLLQNTITTRACFSAISLLIISSNVLLGAGYGIFSCTAIQIPRGKNLYHLMAHLCMFLFKDECGEMIDSGSISSLN
jgi:hypothetical protein